MSVTESTTVRCPHCRKKQPEPCPKRCGCGESLVALLAARRGQTRSGPSVVMSPNGHATGTPPGGSPAPRPRHLRSVPPVPIDAVDNEW